MTINPAGFGVGLLSEFCLSRRRLLIAAGASCLPTGVLLADEAPTQLEEIAIDPEHCWAGSRQLVYAYQQGPTKGEPCELLDLAKEELPVSIIWRLPPDWVKRFPTIHFETSSGKWATYAGWSDREHFVAKYNEFNPPEMSPRQVSPFKRFVQQYDAPYWSWPGRITDHLLDPNGRHGFSEYELRGLKTSEKKRLHAAHHQGLIEPGRKPTLPG